MKAGIFAVVLLCLVGNAGAEEPDMVVLRDGTVLRGHVSELRPGESVRMVLLDGQTRQLPWSAVASTRGPSFAAPGAEHDESIDVFKPGPGRGPLAIEAARPQSVTLHARSDVGVNGLYLTLTKRDLCNTPCTLYLPPGHYWLHTTAEHVTDSDVELDLGLEGRRLRIHSSSAKVRGAGAALTAVGAVAVLAGAIAFILTAMPDDLLAERSGPLLSPDHTLSAYTAGGVLAGAGVASIIAGAILIHRTPSGIERQSALGGANPAPTPQTIDAWVTPRSTGGSAGVMVHF